MPDDDKQKRFRRADFHPGRVVTTAGPVPPLPTRAPTTRSYHRPAGLPPDGRRAVEGATCECVCVPFPGALVSPTRRFCCGCSNWMGDVAAAARSRGGDGGATLPSATFVFSLWNGEGDRTKWSDVWGWLGSGLRGLFLCSYKCWSNFGNECGNTLRERQRRYFYPNNFTIILKKNLIKLQKIIDLTFFKEIWIMNILKYSKTKQKIILSLNISECDKNRIKILKFTFNTLKTVLNLRKLNFKLDNKLLRII